MRRIVIGFLVGMLIPLIALSALHVSSQPRERVYGDLLPYADAHPLPIPPLSAFTIGVVDNDTLIARASAYCSDPTGELGRWFEESNPMRVRALCGMYIIATNAPYHEVAIPVPDALTFAQTPTLHCGTVVVPQGELYTALHLAWRWQLVPGHQFIEVWIDDGWETFDATVNIWYADPQRRRAFWLPDYAGARDYERYGYGVRGLHDAVYAGAYVGRAS